MFFIERASSTYSIFGVMVDSVETQDLALMGTWVLSDITHDEKKTAKNQKKSKKTP